MEQLYVDSNEFKEINLNLNEETENKSCKINLSRTCVAIPQLKI